MKKFSYLGYSHLSADTSTLRLADIETLGQHMNQSLQETNEEFLQKEVRIPSQGELQ
jgi:hypothetical protein